MSDSLPEPWLRGPDLAVHPVARPLVYSLTQVREDLARWTVGLTPDQIWARPFGLGPVGFHIHHIGRSADRLTTYLEGGQLSAGQLAGLKSEMEPGESREQLLEELELNIRRCLAVVEALDPRCWYDERRVGRKRLPTTVAGLVTHLAEHGQRHVGEAIVTAKLINSGTGYSIPNLA